MQFSENKKQHVGQSRVYTRTLGAVYSGVWGALINNIMYQCSGNVLIEVNYSTHLCYLS